jgi:hypothetical protein
MAKSKLQLIADAERQTEIARNHNNISKPYDLSTVPTVNGVDIGLPVDISERQTETARNKYNKSKPYDLNSVQ